MKNMKMVLCVLLIVVTTRAAFAQNVNKNRMQIWELRFVECFEKSDLAGMEITLERYASRMDLSTLLLTVLFSTRSGNGGNALWVTQDDDPMKPLNNNRRIVFDVIELLIKYGVDLNNFAEGFYWRPMSGNGGLIGGYWWAKYAGDFYFENMPLATAISEGFSIQVIRLLLDAGADPNRRINNGFTPLLEAVESENITIIRLLLEYGANVNYAGSQNGRYPLAASNNIEVIKLLLDAGARVNQQNPAWGGMTAAQVAHQQGNFDIYVYLKERGATWTAPNHATLAGQYPVPSSSGSTPEMAYTPSTPAQTGSSSSGQTSAQRTADAVVGALQQVQETLRGSLDTGRYKISGRLEEISLTGMANNGNLYYTDANGRRSTGTWTISGDRLTLNIQGRSYFYTITSRTTFSGNGEDWVRVGF